MADAITGVKVLTDGQECSSSRSFGELHPQEEDVNAKEIEVGAEPCPQSEHSFVTSTCPTGASELVNDERWVLRGPCQAGDHEVPRKLVLLRSDGFRRPMDPSNT